MPEEVAEILTKIVCYKNLFLPQGAPTYPIITNIVFARLDDCIKKYLDDNGNVQYSRYADDITFSCDSKKYFSKLFYRQNKKIFLNKELFSILKKHHCIINYKKLFAKTFHSRLEVKGIVINNKINIKREYLDKLRVILYKCKKDGLYCTALKYINVYATKNKKMLNLVDNKANKIKVEKWFKSVLIGKVRYIGQVKGYRSSTFYSFASNLNIAFGEKVFDIPDKNDIKRITE